MLADIAAVHVFGTAQTRQAAVLDAVHAALASAPPTADALGPVGAAFARALAEAVQACVKRVGDLSAVTANSGVAAHATAAAYVVADSGHRRSLAEVGG